MNNLPSQTIVAHLMDRPGALSRVLEPIRERGLNVESVNVVKTSETGVSRLTMSVATEHIAALRAQLERIIDVLDVQVVEQGGDNKAGKLTDATLSQADGEGG